MEPAWAYATGQMRSLDQASLAWRSETGERLTAVAPVKEAVGEEMTVLLPEELAAGQTLWVYEGALTHTAIVLDCQPSPDGFLVRMAFQRRREVRQPVRGTGVLRWSGPNGPRTVEVQVQDMSASGMQFELSEPIQVDETVRLAGQSFECIGLVRYCTPQGNRFVVGIQFTRPPYDRDSLEYQD